MTPGLRRAGARALCRAVQQQRAVGQPGQRVVQRPVSELGFQRHAVADVLHVHDQVRRVTRSVRHPRSADQHPEHGAVRTEEPALVAQHLRPTLCTRWQADRLRAAVRPEDTPARLGGDEFAVLVESALTEEHLLDLA